MNGQREEALARIGLLCTDNSHQHADVVVNGDQYCAGGLTGDTACLEGNGRLTELEFFDYRVHGVLPSLWLLGETVSCEFLGNLGNRPDGNCPGTTGKAMLQIKLEAGSLQGASGKPLTPDRPPTS
jgi:hypothetical protein